MRAPSSKVSSLPTIAATPRLSRVGREAHRSVETVAIGQRDRRQSKLGRALYQLFGMRTSLQKAKVRPAWSSAYIASG